MSAAVVEWGDPPPDARGRNSGRPRTGRWKAIADAIRSRPGVWGRVWTSKWPTPTNVKVQLQRHGVSAEVASRADGSYGFWARYVGEAEQAKRRPVLKAVQPLAPVTPLRPPVVELPVRRDPDGLYRCKPCSRAFGDRHALARHNRISHGGRAS